MKRNIFPISMAFLWGMVFSQAMHSITLGICMGLLMGISFGLLDSGKGGKKMNKMISNWLALAALLMLVGATFQISGDH